MVVVEEQWALLDTTNGGGVCGAVRATMVVQFAMGAMVFLDQFGRGFGGVACFRMWWITQLELYGFASGAEVV